MDKPRNTLIILSPAFAAGEADTWLPAQERFVLALNRNFPTLQVVILSFHYPVQKNPAYRWHGNEVMTFSGGMKSGLNSPLRWARVWAELKRRRAAHRIVGIFSFFCSECAFVGHYFAKRYRLPHRIWVLGQDARKDNRQVKRIRPAPEELVCISDFLVCEFARNHGIRPAHMIPIGIDTSLFGAPPRSRTIDLLGAGSLIPLKQYDAFIRVVARIAAALPDVHARICGGGPERERLQAMIDTARLSGRISLAGQLPQTEVLQAMQGSRILLHTSSYEGLGAVCLEALYAGAHVISFCRPIATAIPHWHIVQTEEEMAAKAIALLGQDAMDHSSVLPYEVNTTAEDVMRLFQCRG